MSRARGVRGARKMRAFAKDRVAGVGSEEEWEGVLARAGSRLLVAEFAAVRARAPVAASQRCASRRRA
jgi:hypothetical protein